MRTAAYAICKNEINRIDQWLDYTKDFDYRVVLDTGSTDGTYEILKKVPNIVLNQLIIDPFRYDIPRNISLTMIPNNVDWCLCPDIDEYFSINVLEEMEKTIKKYPDVTTISIARLDIRSKTVFIGPPNSLPLNKIHRPHLYKWKSRVCEYLYCVCPKNEVEKYNDKIFLVHDQEVNKSRFDFYLKIMQEEYKVNPLNSWNNSFLMHEYFQKKDMENFVDVGINFLKSYMLDKKESDIKFKDTLDCFKTMGKASNVEDHIKQKVNAFLATLSL